MLLEFKKVGHMPEYQDPTRSLVAGLLKDILESKGNKRGLPLMAPQILADLSSALKRATSSGDYCLTTQLAANQASEIERYTGSVCALQADRFLLGLEQKFDLVTPERQKRHAAKQEFAYKGI